MSFLDSYTFGVVDALSVLTALGHLVLAVLFAILIAESLSQPRTRMGRWIANHVLLLMFIVAAVASLGSLFLSEIAGWNPCKLCWLQRIFMYPQAVVLAIALWKRDRKIAPYILALSLIGIGFAAYHYYIQMYDIIASPANPATPCDASGESCVKTPFVHFGYITIPMMALTAFALNAIGSIFMLRAANQRAGKGVGA